MKSVNENLWLKEEEEEEVVYDAECCLNARVNESID